MIEILLQIPGPTFLMYFIGLALVCIVFAWLWANADGSTEYLLPEPTRLDPIAIAALRGGLTSVIQTAVYSLRSRNLVNIGGEGGDMRIESVSSRQKPSGAIEQEIYQFSQTSRTPRKLFKDSTLRYSIEQGLKPIYRELEQLHVARSGTDHFRAWMATLIMGLVIGAVGGTKLYLGITRGRPVLFLVALLIVSLIVLFRFVKPWAIPTRLGRRYLKALEEHFGWLKEPVRSGRTPEGIDPAFGTAIFGAGILASYLLISQFFSETTRSSGWGGWVGGCGASSGCGGGGGCGGCGGS